MATYAEICGATQRAWKMFESTLMMELGEDFSSREFFNIADSAICKVVDYVMQATNFEVNCPTCNTRCDNEDEINEDGTCWNYQVETTD